MHDQIAQHPHCSLAFEAMGCRFEMLVDAEHESLRNGIDRGECIAICEEMRDLVLDWHNRLSVFESGSVVSQINRAQANEDIVLDAELFDLCVLCEQLRVTTDGAFNIAAGTLMRSHGFRGASSDSLADLTIDDPIVLDKSRHSIAKRDTRIMLDFGAIAKGYMLDLIRCEFAEYGIANAFVHGGTSSAIGLGEQSAADAWRVDLSGDTIVELRDLAIGVSEPRSQTARSASGEHAHVMDPRTMSAVSNPVRRVACVHESAAIADAYSTACCVCPELVERLNDNSCTLIVFDSDSVSTLHDPLGVVRSRYEGRHD